MALGLSLNPAASPEQVVRARTYSSSRWLNSVALIGWLLSVTRGQNLAG